MARALINEIIRDELGEIDYYINNNLHNILPGLVAAVEDVGNPQMGGFREGLLHHRGERRPHNLGYFENIVPLYNVNEFKTHFRMTPQTMQVLCADIARRFPYENMEIPLEKKVMFTMWMLSKPETFLAAGDRFNFSKSTAHRIFYEIVSTIAAGIDNHIKWPTRLQQLHSSEVFKARSGGFEGIIGAIDGCHIQIKKPEGNDTDYYNRKQVHSIILQAICNENCKFINVATGYPGRLHDARVFRNSPIGRELEENRERFMAAEHHLIGDAAYGLSSYLLTPFRDTGHLTQRQTNYNKKLSSVRSVIERAFGRLKGKFRRLKLLELTSLESITKTVLASCVIHNLILENDGMSDEEYSDEEDAPLPEFGNVGNNARGDEKRNNITANLPL